jgi:two-component system sensor histidine kinase KdpD
MTQEERLRSESRATKQRGRLKIFLGAVAGVGKTYRMLSEAHRRVERNGEDVVIGLVETHGRPATAALVAGIEQVPMKAIEYRGKTLYELDTDAVVARHPEWVLVDELAHTNIPGARHPKRWQSVEEIRDAGIGVISTLNIQHLESLNDAVYEITGVRVRETIPDAIVDTAD